MFKPIIAALIGVVALVPNGASGQDNPRNREGFWISFGFGAGSLGSGNSCTSQFCPESLRETGAVAYLRMGGTVSQHALLGVESSGWARVDENGEVSQFGALSLVGFYYPSVSGGFFLRGGVGTANHARNDDRRSGLGLSIGLGIDLKAGNTFSFTPFANLIHGRFSNPDIRRNLLQLGLGFSWS
jgi:hypothetical protein